MTKLINKPQTIPSKGTTNKRNTNFPFQILPKEKETLQFSNKAIDNYLPTFGNSTIQTYTFQSTPEVSPEGPNSSYV